MFEFLKIYDEVDNESCFILSSLCSFLKVCGILLLVVYEANNIILLAVTLSLLGSMILLTGYTFNWRSCYLIYIGISYIPISILYFELLRSKFSDEFMRFRSFSLPEDGLTVTNLVCTAVFVVFVFCQTFFNIMTYKGYLYVKETYPDIDDLSSIDSSESLDQV
ncbi:unnamed protein product [Bursaphelenchus okinawaensis]|uniref:Uncharacterized protein n=1 Tax=Bursaphelenchus okinawaensis TaxID=465554 RepID=A0A811LH73_9BILA|nr:unnamed protein product [Bursaphelenchus okinawaensis]CAG9125224.1 unnamed protein product [Bursaphelenchus okinawaensis]